MDLLVEIAFNIVRAFLISCLFGRILTVKEGGRIWRVTVAYILFALLCFEGSVSAKIISVFAGVAVLAMLFLMEFLGHAYEQNSELLEKQRLEQHERKEYELIKNSVKALRSYQHDYKNQMLTLQTLLSQKKYEEMETYIKELSGFMIEGMWINSGNSALDAVVSAKGMGAEDKGIVFHSEIYGADTLTLRLPDLTSVFGNLLDNAIEACARVGSGAWIDLSIKPKGNMICIKIKNSSDGIYNREGRGLLTRKRDAGHGIGLGRVMEIVEGEGGFCRYVPDRECFTAVIMLPGADCDKGGESCS